MSTPAVTEPSHVVLNEVDRRYEGPPAVHALGPIDLVLRRGEFFSIVGPSGCGKSTLLDALCGLVRPTSGSVQFEGRELRGEVPDGIGVVFQEDSSMPWLSVRQNVAFGLRTSDLSQKESTERGEQAGSGRGLAQWAGQEPAQRAGGRRQRVCIARTLVLRPRLILLDEPFGALDQQTRLLMGDELLRLWRETGATVMLITHALDEAAMLSDRVGVMSARPGRFIDMVETGWPRDRDSRIVSDPAFGTVTARLWSSLRAESLKTMGRAA